MDIQELEARFKEIDERSESERVEVNVAGETESSGELNVSVGREVGADLHAEEAPPPDAGDLSAVGSETLLDVNLGEVEVPDEYVERKVREILLSRDQVGELPGVSVRQIGASERYVVAEDYTYDAGDFRLTALSGFEYNRSSVPRIFWVIIDKDSLSNVAPLFHDLLYDYAGVLPQDHEPPRDGRVTPYRTFLRREVDDLFLELMRKSGVRRWRAKLAYQSVRNFGESAWGK